MSTSIRFLCTVMLSAAVTAAYAQAYSSEAEIWGYNSLDQKIAFLRGFCEGALLNRSGSTDRIGDLSCASVGEKSRGQLFRICGVVNSPSRASASAFLDKFYAAESHSDVPFWAAVASFNDQACREDTVASKLPSLQARGKCNRALAGAMEARVSKEVIERMSAECSAK